VSIRVALCQLNLTVGDLSGNADRVIAGLADAEAAGCDLAVFPELAVSGYPPEDLVFKPRFLADCRRELDRVAAATTTCAAIVGFVDGDSDGHVYNAAAVCARGEVAGVVHKRELPNYTVFDELRHFRPGAEPMSLFAIAGVEVGVTICEDLWIPGGPVNQLVAGGARLTVNINASPYRAAKRHRRNDIVVARAVETAVPIVYVNLVGGQDELVFDGDSVIIDGAGQTVARASQFLEEVLVADVEPAEPAAVPQAFPVIEVTPSREPDDIAPPVEPIVHEPLEPLDEIHAALVLGTRDYVHKNGFTDICLGLSGGIDSALVAVIAVDALGADHVHTVAMPSRFSSHHSLDDAAELAHNLGVDHRVVPIEASHQALLDMLAPSFGGRAADVTEENLQSRIRGVVLMALANKFGWLVLTTGNKSETAVGYSTLYGDTAGAFAVIKDVWKLMVYDLCRRRNAVAGTELIPGSILTKVPSAELRPDQRDDQSLPPYEVLDPLLIELVERDRTAADLIDDGHDPAMVERLARLVDQAEYKRRQNPIGPRVSPKAFGKDRRMPITNRYRSP
jgi:NAD+ synthase (glutamine-hydrolysing)